MGHGKELWLTWGWGKVISSAIKESQIYLYKPTNKRYGWMGNLLRRNNTMRKWFKLLYPLLIFPLLALPTRLATNDHLASYQMNPEERVDMKKADEIYRNFYYDGDKEVFITTIVLLCITTGLLVYNGLKINGMVKRMVFYLVTFAITYALSGWFYNYNHFSNYWYDIFPELHGMTIRTPQVRRQGK